MPAPQHHKQDDGHGQDQQGSAHSAADDRCREYGGCILVGPLGWSRGEREFWVGKDKERDTVRLWLHAKTQEQRRKLRGRCCFPPNNCDPIGTPFLPLFLPMLVLLVVIVLGQEWPNTVIKGHQLVRF
ncbi:hypothetical protein FKM82_021399 [Ascaphus truei]